MQLVCLQLVSVSYAHQTYLLQTGMTSFLPPSGLEVLVTGVVIYLPLRHCVAVSFYRKTLMQLELAG